MPIVGYCLSYAFIDFIKAFAGFIVNDATCLMGVELDRGYNEIWYVKR